MKTSIHFLDFLYALENQQNTVLIEAIDLGFRSCFEMAKGDRYQQITLEEMDQLLDPEKGWRKAQLPGTREVVYEFPLTSRPHIIIRVASSILPVRQISRKVGKDAIRVYAVNTNTNRGWISTTRVYRTPGWRKNLEKAVMKTFTAAQNRMEF